MGVHVAGLENAKVGHVSRYRRLFQIALVLLYLVVTVVGALLVYTRVRAEVARSELLPDFTLGEQQTEEDSNVARVEGQTLPVWQGKDRITVLILGIDERAQTEDFWRTDTMILATLDPVTMKAGVMSIPRDLWVPIPGFTENRINTAHAIGDAYDYPGGGPALAVETVEYNLGVEIDYYVRVNFQAFVDLVDLIGGIDIYVDEPIDDPTYPDYNYGYDPLHIDAGQHHFYGEMALKYARTRHTSGGDFDRARRQQQVIRAILERVTDARMLPQLAARAPEIYQLVQDSVQLDPRLQLDEVIALANLATQVDPEDIQFRVIDETCTLFAETPDGMQILIPLRDRIREVRDEVFGLRPPEGTDLTVAQEAATIAVLNGTATEGLAYATAEFLRVHGLSVTRYTNADRQDYDTSLIIMNRDKPRTALELATLLDLPKSAVIQGANPTADYDIVVILGADFAARFSPDEATVIPTPTAAP